MALFGYFDDATYTEYFKEKLAFLKIFAQSFPATINSLENISSTKAGVISKLFQSDICFYAEVSAVYCGTSASVMLKDFLSRGVSGIFNSYLELFSSEVFLQANSFTDAKYAELLAVHHRSNEYTTLIVEASSHIYPILRVFR